MILQWLEYTSTQREIKFPIAFSSLNYVITSTLTWGEYLPEALDLVLSSGAKSLVGSIIQGGIDGNIIHGIDYLLIGY